MTAYILRFIAMIFLRAEWASLCTELVRQPHGCSMGGFNILQPHRLFSDCWSQEKITRHGPTVIASICMRFAGLSGAESPPVVARGASTIEQQIVRVINQPIRANRHQEDPRVYCSRLLLSEAIPKAEMPNLVP